MTIEKLYFWYLSVLLVQAKHQQNSEIQVKFTPWKILVETSNTKNVKKKETNCSISKSFSCTLYWGKHTAVYHEYLG